MVHHSLLCLYFNLFYSNVLLKSSHFDPATTACHRYGGPREQNLRCDSSAKQIIFNADEQIKKKQQKRNLLIFDIDMTILESMHGFHSAIPLKLRSNGTQCFSHQHIALDMMFMQKPSPFSVVFRKHFFDILKYVHSDHGFSADIVLYTRARREYALEITAGIEKYYALKYGNTHHSSLFKIIVSTTTPQTAKTLSTLDGALQLSEYEHIIILDDDAEDIWCKHRMIRLRLLQKVNVILLQVPVLFIWRDIYTEFQKCGYVSTQARLIATQFYCMVSKYQEKDKLFVHFHDFLELLYWNASRSHNDNLFEYASLIHDRSGFNHMTRISWKWTKTA